MHNCMLFVSIKNYSELSKQFLYKPQYFVPYPDGRMPKVYPILWIVFHLIQRIWKVLLQNQGVFQKLLSPQVSKIIKVHMCIKCTPFNKWTWYFVWNFKGTLWNSTQNILPIHWKMCILYGGQIVRALYSSPPGQNGHHFTGDIFRFFVNEKFYILIKISLKFVPKVPIDNNTAMV